MPAYGFQRRFAPKVRDGSKRHTIRKQRKRPTRPGDLLWLYVDRRMRTQELIMFTDCVAVRPMKRMASGEWYFVDKILGDLPLDRGDLEQLAKGDGFEDRHDMEKWFDRTHGRKPLPDLELISWRYPGREAPNGKAEG